MVLFKIIFLKKEKIMIKCISHRLKNLFNFQDKAGRLDFFCSSIVIILSVIVASETFNFFWAQIYIIFAAFLMLVLHIQRLNHLGKEKKIAFLIIVPVVGVLLYIYLLFAKPKKI